MNRDRTAGLTERQRECLRLLYAHRSAKEIATELGISVGVVHEHLTAARRHLGTTRSIDAARILIQREAAGAPYGVGGEPMGVGSATAFAQTDPADAVARGSPEMVVREDMARYVLPSIEPAPHLQEGSLIRWLFRSAWSERDTLSTTEKVAIGLFSAFFATALFGALLAIQRALN